MVLVVLILALAALLLLGWALARFAQNRQRGLAQASAPAAAAGSAPPVEVPVAQHYRKDTVGNDAAARPWDVAAPSEADFAPSQAAAQRELDLPSQEDTGWLAARPDQLPDRLPGHFDLALLLERSKESFMRLHHAWEQADAAAVRDLLSPKIWQHVEQAMQAQVLPEWGQDIGEVQHLAARALKAHEEEGRLRVQLEFTGSQVLARDGQTKTIHEVWDVAYCEQPPTWEIADLQARAA